MKFIVITSPDFLPGEASLIEELFRNGVDTLHLRKPSASESDCASLIESIPQEWRCRIVVHDHHRLCQRYGLQGVHLNSRNPNPPADFRPSSVSASCHSIAEVERRKADCDYVFLSPIFDSISKQGYHSAYLPQELRQAAEAGIIDRRVVALGGVSLDAIEQLRQWRFGGAAFLGDVWGRVGRDFIDHVRQLRCRLG